jgi:hypothetical protein
LDLNGSPGESRLVLQKIVRLIVCGKQRFNPATESWILPASLIEKYLARSR